MLSTRWFLRREYFGSVIYDQQRIEYIFVNNWITDWLIGGYSLSEIAKKHGLSEMDKAKGLKELNDLDLDVASMQNSLEVINNEIIVGTLSAPLRVYLDATYACNLKCSHCYNRIGVKKQRRLSFEQRTAILHEMRSNGIMKLSIAGGEPFLDKELFPLIEVATSLSISVSLTTNGTVLNEQVIKYLRTSGLKRITFSLDGHDAQTSQLSRPNLDFNLVIANIRAIKAVSDLNVALKCTFNTSFSKERLSKIVELAESLNVDVVKFNFERDLLSTTRNADYTETVRYFSLWEYLLKLKNNSSVKMIFNQQNVLANFTNLNTNWIGMGCPAGRDLMCINPYGEVKGCVLLPEEFIAGKYPEQDIMTLWRSAPMLTKLRKKFLNDKCTKCNYIQLCRGGCIQRRVLHGGIKQPDYYCFQDIEDNFKVKEVTLLPQRESVFCYKLAHL